MNKSPESLLQKIAGLPLNEQHWLIKQLTKEQRKRFIHLGGTRLVHPNPPKERDKSPECKAFHKHSPLFLALILEQQHDAWSQAFITEYLAVHHLASLPTDQLNHIKLATKKSLFNHWQHSFDFATHLEVNDGTNN